MAQQWQQFEQDSSMRHAQMQTGPPSGGARHSRASSYNAMQQNMRSTPQRGPMAYVGGSISPSSRPESSNCDVAMEDAGLPSTARYARQTNNSQRPSGPYTPRQQAQSPFQFQQLQQQQRVHNTNQAYSPSTGLSVPYTPRAQSSVSSPYSAHGPQTASANHSPIRSTAPFTSNDANMTTPSTVIPYRALSDHSLTIETVDYRQAQMRLPPLQSSVSSAHSYYPHSATAQLNAVFGREQHSPSHGRSATQSSRTELLSETIPRFERLGGVQDLLPRMNPQPAFRRANPEGGFISPLLALTTHLPSTYRICNPAFKYESSRNPRRVLTKPSKGAKNDGFDNEDSDYILYVNDILGNEDNGHKNRYLILDVLGQGTFGQVVKCQNLRTQEVVAVKVVKNRTAYFNQSMMEVSVLDLLNGKLDKNDDHHLLRLKDTFIHRQHLCLVFELLSVNLYELIKQNQFRGLSTTLVRVFAQQLLNGLSLLNKARLIHCDLKPENILLKNLESPVIKIIDFGSACDERQTVYTYIQSRFYRSPEVLFGLPYSSAIDMWSLGCIVVELFLGLPLFPGSSEYNQVTRITEMLGMAPTWMLEMGKQSGEFFQKTQDDFGRRTYKLKSLEQYSREHNTKEQPSKKYFQATTLPEIVQSYSMPRKNMKQAEIDREMNNRYAFIDFVRGLLNINPLERWSPQQAKLHPFITQQKFTGPFVPPMNLKSSSITKTPAPGVQQQQQAEAVSKQRAQAANAQMHAQVQTVQNAQANQGAKQHRISQYVSSHGHPTTPSFTNNGFVANNVPGLMLQGQPLPSATSDMPNLPSYSVQPPSIAYSSPSGSMIPHTHPQNSTIPQTRYLPPSQNNNLYPQAANRVGRQRASTMDFQQGGVPQSIQRVASHLDPNAPIRLQPSPAYYPPPPDGFVESGPSSARRKATGARSQFGPTGGVTGAGSGPGRNRNFIQTMEDRTMEEGYVGQPHWQ